MEAEEGKYLLSPKISNPQTKFTEKCVEKSWKMVRVPYPLESISFLIDTRI